MCKEKRNYVSGRYRETLHTCLLPYSGHRQFYSSVLEFLNSLWERNKNRVAVPARQATKPGGIGSLESILGLLKSLKIRALLATVCHHAYIFRKMLHLAIRVLFQRIVFFA
jgi:hypothetical protein